MDFEVESLKKIKQATVKNINELGKKTELTSAETKAAIDGFNLLDRVCEEIEECGMKENESEYSGHNGGYVNPRRYSITSYGRTRGRRSSYGEPMDSHGYYRNEPMSYGGSMAYENSMARNRSYNGLMSYAPYMDPMYYGEPQGYSRHSIGDRAISCLEREMDSVGSEYERQELRRFIEMIRSAE